MLAWLSVQAIAAGPPPAEPSPELRARMAAAHQKMADCLKSSRPIAECRAEMRESCRGMMDEHGCSMMGTSEDGMGMGAGHTGGGMMHPSPEPKK
jgi:hypothetical protein